MLDEIALLSGNDVSFFSAKINIHPPTIKEIAFIGEESFFTGCQLLNFSKEVLNEEDKINLVDTHNFDILMSILCEEEAIVQQLSVMMVLGLLFPDYSIVFELDGIHLKSENDSTVINKDNFNEFQEIIKKLFGLEKSKTDDYKPLGKTAQKIADKLRKGREKVAEAKAEKTNKIAIFSRYVSILATGLHININTLLEYTVYQLYDQFKRFQMLQTFDINLRARMAGATDLEEVDNWMDDLYSHV